MASDLASLGRIVVGWAPVKVGISGYVQRSASVAGILDMSGTLVRLLLTVLACALDAVLNTF